ncbi:MAG: hypothetical protein ACYCPA_00730 [Acidithiobacillus sp.]
MTLRDEMTDAEYAERRNTDPIDKLRQHLAYLEDRYARSMALSDECDPDDERDDTYDEDYMLQYREISRVKAQIAAAEHPSLR